MMQPRSNQGLACVDNIQSSSYFKVSKYNMEGTMLEVTESARKEFDAYFAGKDKATIRVYLAPGG